MQIEMEALKRRLYGENQVKNIKFYPGTNADVAPEDMAREINKFFAEAENPACEADEDEPVEA